MVASEQVRKDFELCMVFGIQGVPTGAGYLQRMQNGDYLNGMVQLAWLGFRAGYEANRLAPKDWELDVPF